MFLFQTLSVILMTPAIHLVLESWTYMWQKEAYQGLAMGAKMEGIMESLAQTAHFITAREKKCAKKKNF